MFKFSCSRLCAKFSIEWKYSNENSLSDQKQEETDSVQGKLRIKREIIMSKLPLKKKKQLIFLHFNKCSSKSFASDLSSLC